MRAEGDGVPAAGPWRAGLRLLVGLVMPVALYSRTCCRTRGAFTGWVTSPKSQQSRCIFTVPGSGRLTDGTTTFPGEHLRPD